MIDDAPVPKRKPNEFCASIKLTAIKDIQSYGCLLAIDRDFHVCSYSENMDVFFETKTQDILSQSILFYLKSPQEDDDIKKWLLSENKVYKDLIWQSHEKKIPISTFIHQTQGLIILEFEHSQDNTNQIRKISSMEVSNSANSIQDMAQLVCENIKLNANFDRIMIYQFDHNTDDGLVIAEVVEENMDSFLGTRFPADDIPQTVRDMYLINPLRYIPSILHKPIPIVSSTLVKSQHTLNISETNLRGLVPIHMKYMINMKVVSSTSIAIIFDDKLWGLIICHHKEPKYLSVALRQEFVLISKLLADQISVIELAINRKQQQRAKQLQKKLYEYINNETSFLNAVELYHSNMMDLMLASGMTVYMQNIVKGYGDTPDKDETHNLVSWLDKQDFTIIKSTSISSYNIALKSHHKDKVCGLLAIKFKKPDNGYLLFFRPEHLFSIKWAGNPDDILRNDHESYSPRNSFNAFVETIDSHSLPWTNEDLQSAEFIRTIAVDKLQAHVKQ